MNMSFVEEISEYYGIHILPTGDSQTGDVLLSEVRTFLAAQGVDPDNERALDLHFQEMRQRYWGTVVDPVRVAQEGSPLVISLRLPWESLSGRLQWTVVEEQKAQHQGGVNVEELPVQQQRQINDQWYGLVALELPLTLPRGYHDLFLSFAGAGENEESLSCRLIIAPLACYLPPALEKEERVWGISGNLDILRSKNSWGIGDFSDLRAIFAWAAENGAAAVAVNPLLASAPPTDHWHGSRRAASLGFLSPLYLDPKAMDDFAESKAARDLFHDSTFQIQLARLRDQDLVDLVETAEVKMTMLEMLWKNFQENHLDPETPRGRQFREYQRMGGDELWAWSVFIALQDHFRQKENQAWQAWPTPFQDPQSAEVREFAQKHADRLSFQQYLQWQADLQLQAVGRRSMELGLKVGLLVDAAVPVSHGSFETWYRQDLYAGNLNIQVDADLPDMPLLSGGPPILPARLRQAAYAPFITILRAGMKNAGGIRIDCRQLMEHQYWVPAGNGVGKGITLRYPVEELLAVITLESRRNQCMIICEHADVLPEELQAVLVEKQCFLSHLGRFAVTAEKEWLAPGQYPSRTIVAAGSDETTLDDFWSGRDIARQVKDKAEDQSFRRDELIIARAADRAHLLIALQQEELLPEGYSVDPVNVPRLTPALATAVHLFLARSAARIFLLQLENIPGTLEEVSSDPADAATALRQPQPLIDFDALVDDAVTAHLLEAFCKERGVGVVKPSALLTSRQKERTAVIPRVSYRLQLKEEFSFIDVTTVVPYLHELGVSHCYLSPYLQARPGSAHGYDIIDHCAINAEIGSREEYEEFVAALDRHDMAQLFDMVPNHMGVGSDNQWWVDVLENGQASLYADFFDINWHPQQRELQGRILLPVLGGYYGTELEDGRLRLEFVGDQGAFFILYYEHRFPVAPDTYPLILEHDLQRLEARLGTQHEGFLELQSLISSLSSLPLLRNADLEQVRARQRNMEVQKRLLARLCREVAEILSFVEENVILYNGRKGDPESFDLLHELLNRQAYRLAFWRVASDEINYRRFFDINDLAGLRIEDPRVFAETHRLVLDLVNTGKIDGLRIDHPDGLYNPGEYFHRLQAAAGGSAFPAERDSGETWIKGKQKLPYYIVVEKILADFEHLHPEWQVHGTTGYDFAVTVNGLFIDPASEKKITAIYHQFIGEGIDPDFQVYRCKKLIIRSAMAGELNVLAEELHKLAKMNRYTQDFTLNGLREALIEVIAFFPVYRTYISSDNVAGEERNYVEWAVAAATKRQQADDTLIYDFIKETLLLESDRGKDELYRKANLDFVMKLQQYTGPVMAKGLEDTFCYIYNRLVSLNEVGGDPRRYGFSVSAFHHANSERQRHWPHAMLNTSTHDSKRSEDVRCRINVLSEIPREWGIVLRKWGIINRGHKTKTGKGFAPAKNDEYAFYQNLLGIWPLGETTPPARKELADRVAAYMLKAIREAKVHTSWINQNPVYEEAVETFVRNVLAEDRNAFLEEFLPFQNRVAWFGMMNSLAQLLLKLTSPGVPDIYQGNEVWHFCLVDPDNRRPIDFARRKTLLDELHGSFPDQAAVNNDYLDNILENLIDGRIKLYTTWKTLSHRRQHKELFETGTYLPLQARGSKKEHLCAFLRHKGEKTIITVVPRLCARLLDGKIGRLPCGPDVWDDTALILPENSAEHFSNIFTGEEISVDNGSEKLIPAARIFSVFPVALLGNT
ncbi:MAG: malto-oligosyltrehalose synthase [Desulfobulbaceae bacterium]|nr:malto-oligosyltrehalose synthase [Desulfobulbaceae bacterium]